MRCTSVGSGKLFERQAVLLCQALQRVALVQAHLQHNRPAQPTQEKALSLAWFGGFQSQVKHQAARCIVRRRRRLRFCPSSSCATGDWSAPRLASPARPAQLPPPSSATCMRRHTSGQAGVTQACPRVRWRVSRHISHRRSHLGQEPGPPEHLEKVRQPSAASRVKFGRALGSPNRQLGVYVTVQGAQHRV